MRFTRMFAGGDGTPKHLFPHCPHVKRMMGQTNVAAIYKLSPNARVLQSVRCKWCRTLFLELSMIEADMPQELIDGFKLVPKETATA